ncbi:MAG: M48 family metalloprotease [Nannocystaceae bacterium]
MLRPRAASSRRSAAGGRALALAGALVVSACTYSKAVNRLRFNLVNEVDEIALGRQLDASVVEAAGLCDHPGIDVYVTGIGARLAARGERPALPWIFRVTDDADVNAFALPGGHVYVTRGLLAHLSAESELAAALAHEIAHVNAYHGVNQYSRARVAQGGVGFFRVIDPGLRHVGGAVAGSAGLALLRRSREDELEADALGLRYLTAAGYEAAGIQRLLGHLATLARDRARAAEDPQQDPWLSTHPDPELRYQTITRKIAEADASGGERGEERLLARIDGMRYGPDPREGFVDARTFYHPRAGFEVTFPAAWEVAFDGRTVVAAYEPGARRIQVLGATEFEDPAQATTAFFNATELPHGPSVSGEVSGHPVLVTEFAAANDLLGRVAFIEYRGRVLLLAGFAAREVWEASLPAFQATLASFRDIADPAVLAVSPARLAVITLDRPTSPRELLGDAPPRGVRAQDLAWVNHAAIDERLPAGARVKVIVTQPPQAAAISGPQALTVDAPPP